MVFGKRKTKEGGDRFYCQITIVSNISENCTLTLIIL